MMRIRYLREVVTPEAAAGMPQEVRDIEDAYGRQLVEDKYAVELPLPKPPKEPTEVIGETDELG